MGDNVQYDEVKHDIVLLKLVEQRFGDILSIAEGSGDMYLISNDYLIKLRDNGIAFKRKLFIKGFNLMACAEDVIGLANKDSGSILITNDRFEKQLLFHIGEHISDICAHGNMIFATTYYDNMLVEFFNGEPVKEVELPFSPQCIAFFNGLYVLMNDAFYSYISLYDTELNLIKTIKLLRQIGIIRFIEKKLVFYGDNLSYILNEHLKILSIKRSTGINLCKFGNYPIFEDGDVLDVVNNIKYP